MRVWSFDLVQLTTYSNEVKEFVLLNAGKPEMAEEYAIAVTERNMFGKLWDKVRGNEPKNDLQLQWVYQKRPEAPKTTELRDT